MRVGTGAGGALGAAGHRAHAGHQFAHAERFREIVVGSQFQAEHPVGLLAARAEDDDGHVGDLADAPADVDAVHVRQSQVEQDDIAVRASQPLGAGGDVIDRQPVVPEPLGERLGDRLVVLDEQRPYGHASCLSMESGQHERRVVELATYQWFDATTR
ncbi:hypothetical protein GCM10020256_02000 [Streptomyces thermocoprophilus]